MLKLSFVGLTIKWYKNYFHWIKKYLIKNYSLFPPRFFFFLFLMEILKKKKLKCIICKLVNFHMLFLL